MIYQVFCIKDYALQSYNIPMYFQTPLQATRAFRMEVQHHDPKNTIHHKPEDFDLYLVATYDTDTGLHNHLPSPELILRGVDATK